MPHFGSGDWNNPTGLVAQLTSLGVATILTASATVNSSTEGVDQLTYTTRRAGMYRVSASLRVNVASDAANSLTGASFVSFNNGAAIAAASILTAQASPLSLKGAVGTNLMQSQTMFCANATNIVMITQQISGIGTATVGKYDILFTIEAL